MKTEMEIHGCGEKYNVNKKVKGEAISFPFDIKALGKNIKWGKGNFMVVEKNIT